jgi:hypothetical protein
MKSTRSSDMTVSFPWVSRAWTSRGPRTHRVRSVVPDEFAVLDHASVHRPVSGGRRHDTPVSDQVSDNGTEHSGISVPGPGRLATGKIIKRRPSEVLRDEEVSGISAIRTSIMPTQTNMTVPPVRCRSSRPHAAAS